MVQSSQALRSRGWRGEGGKQHIAFISHRLASRKKVDYCGNAGLLNPSSRRCLLVSLRGVQDQVDHLVRSDRGSDLVLEKVGAEGDEPAASTPPPEGLQGRESPVHLTAASPSKGVRPSSRCQPCEAQKGRALGAVSDSRSYHLPAIILPNIDGDSLTGSKSYLHR